MNKIWTASMHGDPVEMERLFVQGISVDIKSEHGWTPLMYAASSSNLSVASWLIDRGASVDERDELGWTAAMVAADNGSIGVIDLLQRAGADFSLMDSDGSMASDRARVNHHPVLASILDRWLLERACPPTGKSDSSPRL